MRKFLILTAFSALVLASPGIAQEDLDLTTQWEPTTEPTAEQNLESAIANPPAEMPSSDFSVPGPLDSEIVPSETCCSEAPGDFTPGPALQWEFE